MTVLLCDVGGVLIQNPWVETAMAVGERCGLEPKGVFDLLTRLSRELDSGRLTLLEFHRRLCETLVVEMPFDFFDRTLDASLKRILPVWDAVRYLREEQRVEVIALSNMSREVWASLQKKFDIGSLFDSEVLSYELGTLKPDPAIYRAALARAGSPARSCLFVDDVAENIEAAEALGIRTLRAGDLAATASFLRSLVG